MTPSEDLRPVAAEPGSVPSAGSLARHRLSFVLAFLLLAICGGCGSEPYPFEGIYVEESHLKKLAAEAEGRGASSALLAQLGIEATPSEWYKIEFLPGRILIDDGRKDLDDFDVVEGRVKFATWTMKGWMESHHEGRALILTLTHRLSGDQERYHYRKVSPEQWLELVEPNR